MTRLHRLLAVPCHVWRMRYGPRRYPEDRSWVTLRSAIREAMRWAKEGDQ